METLVDGRLGLRDNRDVHAALSAALAVAARTAVRPMGHPQFKELYGFTSTPLRAKYADESSRPDWIDPGTAAREKAFKKLQRELGELIAEEEALLAKIADWKGETAEEEREAALAAAAVAAKSAEEAEAKRRLGEMGEKGAATAVGIIGELRAGGWASHIGNVAHWQPPLPEVTDWVFDVVDEVEAIAASVTELIEELCTMTNGGGQRTMQYPLPRRRIGYTNSALVAIYRPKNWSAGAHWAGSAWSLDKGILNGVEGLRLWHSKIVCDDEDQLPLGAEALPLIPTARYFSKGGGRRRLILREPVDPTFVLSQMSSSFGNAEIENSDVKLSSLTTKSGSESSNGSTLVDDAVAGTSHVLDVAVA